MTKNGKKWPKIRLDSGVLRMARGGCGACRASETTLAGWVLASSVCA
jgi:hypothetical protein